MRRPGLIGVSLFLFLATAWPAAQQPQTAPQTPPAQTPAQPRLTFRVDTNYIEVDAVVTDSKGAFVRSLTQNDFELFEDGKAQEIGTFGLVDIPLERDDKPLFAKSPIEPDVATNEKDFEGRIYVLVLDANHVPAQDSFLVKKTALEFINRYLGANDVAAVVHAQTTAMDFNQEFTNSRPRLRMAVDRFAGEKLGSRALAVREVAIQSANLGRAGIDPRDAKDPNATERAARANATIDTMEKVSRHMNGLRGRRKAVILISEGLDFNLDDNLGPGVMPASSNDGIPRDPIASNSFNEAYHASGIVERMQSMYESASRSNVAIYTVDPRGVASELDTLINTPGMPDAFPIDIGNVTAGVREELRRQIGTLRSFAEVTGGLALVGTNDFATGFKKIVDDNSAYYVLGYRPTQPKTDGKFHNINVRLKRPGLQVRARRGYYARKDAAALAAAPAVDPVIELINSPMAVGGLGMRTTLTVEKGIGAKVRVQPTLEISGELLAKALAADVEVPGNRVNIAFVAIDQASGKVAASGRKSMDLAVKPESRKAIAEHGLRLVTEFELAPGKYQFRIGAHEPSGNGGSVFTDLDVPDFSRGSIIVAPVTLMSARAGRTPTSIDAAGLPKVLPGPPTAARVFSLDDTLAIYTDIYDNDLDRPHKIDIEAIVRTDDGTVAHKVSEERDSKDADKARGGYNFLAKIPLQDLRPGRYVLTVQAKSRLGGADKPTAKDVEFSIK